VENQSMDEVEQQEFEMNQDYE